MPPAAVIKINGSPGSNDDVAINSLVALDNVNAGGEVSYLWAILSQPTGTADALSSTTIQAPTFTPKKEGTYLLELVVNLSLATEVRDRVVVGIRQLKSRERIPAANEDIEDSTTGWSVAVQQNLRRLDNVIADPGFVVGTAGAAGLLPGNVVRITAQALLKGFGPVALQETVPSFTKALATAAANLDEMLFVVVSGVDGSLTPALNDLIKVRWMGRFAGLTGAPSVGDSVFVSDTGTIALAAGTNSRRIGHVIFSSAGAYDVWVNGVGVGT